MVLRSFAWLALPIGLAIGSSPGRAPVPFAPGERAEYKVKLGWLNAGQAHLAVAGVEDVRGSETYRIEMDIKGGIPGCRVDDVMRSWLSTENLASLRFIKDIHECKYDPPLRQWEIHPEQRTWERTDGGENGRSTSVLPLDELAFIYFIRTLPSLNVGETLTFDRYFKEDGNPVVIQVLRKERRKEDAGTYNTVVVRPIIKTSQLFSQGKAELYFTDDAARHLVYMHVEMPVVGSLTLHLQKLMEGTPITASASSRAPGR
jgi:hypothetical protein